MTVLTKLEQTTGLLIVSGSLAANLDANIYAGGNNTNIELPYVVCSVENAEEFIRNSGIYRCDLNIKVGEKAIDTNASSSLTQTVYDMLAQGNVTTQLRTLSSSSLFVYNMDVSNMRNNVNEDEKSRVQETLLEVICALQ